MINMWQTKSNIFAATDLTVSIFVDAFISEQPVCGQPESNYDNKGKFTYVSCRDPLMI